MKTNLKNIDDEYLNLDQPYYYIDTKEGTIRANSLNQVMAMWWSKWDEDNLDGRYSAIRIGKVG